MLLPAIRGPTTNLGSHPKRVPVLPTSYINDPADALMSFKHIYIYTYIYIHIYIHIYIYISMMIYVYIYTHTHALLFARSYEISYHLCMYLTAYHISPHIYFYIRLEMV